MTGPLKVLLIVKGLGLGGAERLIVEQALAANPADFEYTVAYVRPDKNHFVAELNAGGVRAICLSQPGRKWPVELARLLRSSRPDIVHVHSPLPAAVARPLIRLGVAGKHAAMVYTEHNRWDAYRAPTRWANGLTMWADNQTWAVSREAADSVRPGRLRRRVEPLRHGIDLNEVRTKASQFADRSAVEADLGPATFVFVHVANRRPEKAHEVLLDAFEAAAAQEPRLRLWLVGQHLNDEPLRRRLDSHPVRDRVRVLGYRTDVPALMAAADALVLSSDHEGLPVAIMEAAALGRPVVATAVGGVPEVVQDGIEGLLVPPRRPELLADAMVRLAGDHDLWARLVTNTVTGSERFSAAAVHGEIEARYVAIVSER